MEQKPSTEERFREALKDVIAITKALSPHCSSIDDLTSMAELALSNDGQLHLLMAATTGNQKTR